MHDNIGKFGDSVLYSVVWILGGGFYTLTQRVGGFCGFVLLLSLFLKVGDIEALLL